jgi:hypothetical protein
MKKIILYAAILGILHTTVSAQTLTERVDDVSTYKIGNRPAKGTKVLTFGLNINDTDGNLFSKYNLFQKGNLITGKYFISDRTAIRGGIRLSKESAVSGGDVDTTLTGGSIVSNSLKDVTRNYALMPGLERHFSYDNFFDIYAGGDLYLGFEKMHRLFEEDYTNGFYTHRDAKTTTTKLGLGGVIGINVFVMDLPVSVGVEYGIAGVWNLGGKTHVVEDVKDPLGERTNEYYTQDRDAFGNADGATSYSKLKKNSSSLETNSNVRVLLNIYFK